MNMGEDGAAHAAAVYEACYDTARAAFGELHQCTGLAGVCLGEATHRAVDAQVGVRAESLIVFFVFLSMILNSQSVTLLCHPACTHSLRSPFFAVLALLAIRTELGPLNPEAANALDVTAATYEDQGDWVNALEQYDALAIP